MISKFFTRIVDPEEALRSSFTSDSAKPAQQSSSTAKPTSSVAKAVTPAAAPSPTRAAQPTGRAAAGRTTQKRPASGRLLEDIERPKRAAKASGPAGVKYTPLELQVLELKEQHPGTLLMIECGYKYQFFAEDAEIAARVLGICAYQKCNLLTASVPVGRLHVHCGRLVNAGYKVGVVRQTETAALKTLEGAGSKTFARELDAVYTRATYFGADFDSLDAASPLGDSSQYIMVVLEDRQSATQSSSDDHSQSTAAAPLFDGSTAKVRIAMLAARPMTGELIYDYFEDEFVRSALETRLDHLKPCELVLPADDSALLLSRESAALLDEYSRSTWCNRVERLNGALFDERQALDALMQAFGNDSSSSSSSNNDGAVHAEVMERIMRLPKPLIACFGVLLHHLQTFQLESALALVDNWQAFESAQTMRLPGTCLSNLELLRNQTNLTRRGSLLDFVDHCSTAFGGRLLEDWLRRPLLARADIAERHDAVAELAADPQRAAAMRSRLAALPDLERAICRLYYKKCSPKEYIHVLDAFALVLGTDLWSSNQSSSSQLSNQSSALLQRLLDELALPVHRCTVDDFLGAVCRDAALRGDLSAMFTDGERFPDVHECREQLQLVEAELAEHLAQLQRRGWPSATYVAVNQTEYMIQLPVGQEKRAPADWTRVSKTTKYVRFHTPFVEQQLLLLNGWRERLQQACTDAWSTFLGHFARQYGAFRRIVRALATLDCLLSLAVVAQTAGYVRPELLPPDAAPGIDIVDGRNPIAERLVAAGGFVPNSVRLGCGTGPRCVVLTGANMGGKSTTMRQVALICLLAQIGSFVPAAACRLTPVDAIFTRMGASDDLAGGRSTFFVELEETAEVLARATARSLVILDELGRGTSTHDGAAIAMATLDYLVRDVGCWTMFATHYQQVTALADSSGGLVANYHMGFVEQHSADVVFLYKLRPGIAKSSYGMNVARLAGIPDPVVAAALARSREFALRDAVKNPLVPIWLQVTDAIDRYKRQPDDPATVSQLRSLMASVTLQVS